MGVAPLLVAAVTRSRVTTRASRSRAAPPSRLDRLRLRRLVVTSRRRARAASPLAALRVPPVAMARTSEKNGDDKNSDSKDGEDDKGGNDGAATFSGVPAVVAGVVGIAIAALI